MNCRRMKKLIVLLVDGELDERYKDKVLKHLYSCTKCQREFNKAFAFKEFMCTNPELLSLRDDIVGDLQKSTGPAPKVGFFHIYSKALAACVILLFFVCSFIPVDGEPLGSTFTNGMQSLIKSISYKISGQNGKDVDITVKTGPIPTKRTAHDQWLEQYVKENTQISTYTDMDTAKDKISVKFIEPNYISSGMKLECITESVMLPSINPYYVVKIQYIPDGSGKNVIVDYKQSSITSMVVTYGVYKYPGDPQLNTGKKTFIYPNSTVVKEASVSGIPGYILYTGRDNIKRISINFVLPEYDYFSVSAAVTPINENSYDVQIVETELKEIAESILKSK